LRAAEALVLDAAIISSAQAVEYSEITCYALIAWAGKARPINVARGWISLLVA